MMRFRMPAYLGPNHCVATSAIWAGAVDLRREGPHGTLRTALTLDEVPGEIRRLPTELPDDRALVADQPLIVDVIVDRMAVGDDPVARAFSRWLRP